MLSRELRTQSLLSFSKAMLFNVSNGFSDGRSFHCDDANKVSSVAVSKNGAHQLYEMTECPNISDNTVIKVIGICDASR